MRTVTVDFSYTARRKLTAINHCDDTVCTAAGQLVT